MRYSLLLASVVALQPVAQALPWPASGYADTNLAPQDTPAGENDAGPKILDGADGNPLGYPSAPPAPASKAAKDDKDKDAQEATTSQTIEDDKKGEDGAKATDSKPKLSALMPDDSYTKNDPEKPETDKKDGEATESEKPSQGSYGESGSLQMKLVPKKNVKMEELASGLEKKANSVKISDEAIQEMKKVILKAEIAGKMTNGDRYRISAGIASTMKKYANGTGIFNINICVEAVTNSLFEPNKATELLATGLAGLAATGEPEDKMKSACEKYGAALEQGQVSPEQGLPGLPGLDSTDAPASKDQPDQPVETASPDPSKGKPGKPAKADSPAPTAAGKPSQAIEAFKTVCGSNKLCGFFFEMMNKAEIKNVDPNAARALYGASLEIAISGKVGIGAPSQDPKEDASAPKSKTAKDDKKDKDAPEAKQDASPPEAKQDAPPPETKDEAPVTEADDSASPSDTAGNDLFSQISSARLELAVTFFIDCSEQAKDAQNVPAVVDKTLQDTKYKDVQPRAVERAKKDAERDARKVQQLAPSSSGGPGPEPKDSGDPGIPPVSNADDEGDGCPSDQYNENEDDSPIDEAPEPPVTDAKSPTDQYGPPEQQSQSGQYGTPDQQGQQGQDDSSSKPL